MIIPSKIETEKEFIYYPSLSAGSAKSWLKKNQDIHDGLTSRFYHNSFPNPFYHPYFLVTAGHHYKDIDLRAKFGLDESVQVIGDSGGYQLASGAIKWDSTFKERIFTWLEANSDIALNLDLPPRRELSGEFQKCLDISLENFKYFETHQSGKTAFLNVLQGNDEVSYDLWFSKVKDFQFSGWGLGNCRKIDNLFYCLKLFLENKTFEDPNFKFLHILGASKLYDFFVYEYLQKAINRYTNGKIQVSTDSSSPALGAAYAYYYVGYDWKSGVFIMGDLRRTNFEQNGFKFEVNSELPCIIDCPICKGKTYADIEKFNTRSYMLITTHNVCIFIKAVNDIKTILKSHDGIIADIVDPITYKVCMGIREMFESGNPAGTYEKLKPIMAKYNSMNNMSNMIYKKGGNPEGHGESIKTFFEF